MHRRTFLASVAFLVTSLALSTACGKTNLKTLTVDEVAARLAAKDGKTFAFDDNNHDLYVKGHLPGAKWIATPEPTAADLPADKTATLIFYCHNEL
jgi:hypothetical protein